MSEPEYTYAGGGYFREKSVPKGEVGKMLHGNEVINHFTKVFAARDRELAKACELIQWLTDPSSVEENTLAIQLAPAFLARHQPRKETT